MKRNWKHNLRRNELLNTVGISCLWICAGIVSLLFLGIIIYLLIQGGGYLFDVTFYSTQRFGIGRELFNTIYILLLAQIILLPIALAAAIYLTEYAKPGKLVNSIHFAAETLASVPSLVLGLFGVLVFVTYFHLGTSRIAGALTLLCLNLPLALRLFEDAITSVPRELRESGYALGSTTWHTILTLVLPSALPGIVTAIILTSGRVVGESAAFLFTMGLYSPVHATSIDWSLPGATLTTHLYNIIGPGSGSLGLTSHQEASIAAGSAALLLVILLVFNFAARGMGDMLRRHLMAE
jgi:phosphate transport system permease protein